MSAPRKPWWFRFLWNRTDLAYGYLLRRNPNYTGWWWAFGNGYETFLQVVARRRGWFDQPDPAQGVPAWLEATFTMFMVKRTNLVERYNKQHYGPTVSVKVAAEMARVPEATIRRWCRQGDLEAERTGWRSWKIDAEAVRSL